VNSPSPVTVAETGKQSVIGAAPEGASDPHLAAHAVREMFTSIAPRYDLLNHLLSFNVDRLWWRRAARAFRHVLRRRDARVLDLCCGTGDMTFALSREAGKASPQIWGADFSHTMLRRAAAKSIASAGHCSPIWIEADALRLPFPSQHFDLVTSAFGFRNLADYDAGLREIARVLRPEGLFCLADHALLVARLLGEKVRGAREIRALMMGAGLTVRKQQTMGMRFVLITVAQ